MKIRSEIKSQTQHKPSTPRNRIKTESSKDNIISGSYKPRNFEGSDQIFKASKQLTYIHRNLHSARPKRIKTRDIFFDKGIGTLENLDKETEFLMKPKFEINLNFSNFDKDRVKTLTFEQTYDKTQNNERKAPKRIKSNKRYFSMPKTQKNHEIRNYDSFVSEKPLKKYDFSGIRIRNIFSFKNF